MPDRLVSKVNVNRANVGAIGEKTLASGTAVSMRLWQDEKPGEPVQSTRRDYETVGFVLDGRAELDVEGQKTFLTPGDSWVVPRGKAHSYKILEPFTAVEAISPATPSKGLEADEVIQRDVVEELEFDPRVSAQAIGVRVQEGIVTLMGTVDSYSQRSPAEDAAKRVAGVRGVANELDVRIPGETKRTDEDIARDALHALELRGDLPAQRLKITVDAGWLTLEGEMDWQHQRSLAEEVVAAIPGVTGVTDRIEVSRLPLPVQIRHKIKAAYIRNAKLEAREIAVEIGDHRIILRGTVQSWAEKVEAERIAWSIPGVTQVENRIFVSP